MINAMCRPTPEAARLCGKRGARDATAAYAGETHRGDALRASIQSLRRISHEPT